MNRNPCLDQNIDELGCGQEIRLIRRNDEAARIAFVRSVQQLVILQRQPALLTTEALRAVSTGRSITCCGRGSATLALGPATGCLRHFLRDHSLNFSDVLRSNRPEISTAALD